MLVNNTRSWGGLLLAASFFSTCIFPGCKNDKYKDWKVYGGGKENTHYSALRQIDTSNVSGLEIAWQFNTNDEDKLTQMQVNPMIFDSTLYCVSPKLKLYS